MKVHIITAALLACMSVPLTGQATTAHSPSADEVVARMLAHEMQRETTGHGYTGIRHYDLENPQFAKYSHLVANVTCDPDGTMHFQIVSKEGWGSGNSSLRQALEMESEFSRPMTRPMTQIDKENYELHMTGTALLNGRTAYVIDVVPKRQEVYLFQGKIWVDAEDYALARIDGQLAKTPSIWIRTVRFTLEFRKSGEYWFPSLSTSTSDVRVFGPTSVNIQFLGYSPQSASAAKHFDLSPLEASYVQH
ncbi:MAG: hypothetical protein P4K93_02345 [Terracidiphilus sp.]|nr:hypothetical protein [Terracidiphilus sp.]